LTASPRRPSLPRMASRAEAALFLPFSGFSAYAFIG